MTINEYFNKLNDKYNLYRFEITCAEERREFYKIMAEVKDLDIPAVEIDDKDFDKVLELINR